ncbi:MAG: glycosyltransferase, partial [Bacteroidia bacterium]|nr:glycosyltransferase [Bacteroidia bacterium]
MIFNFLLLIILAYVVLIGYFILGFDKVEECNISNYKSDTKFSVIIPFRNEANILKNLLTTLLKNDYPKDNLEVIFVDDESTDASKHMIEDTLQQSSIDFKIINNKRLSNSPKKDAVREAIICSKYTWIVTTDADCYLQEKWLYELSTIIQEKSSKMIVAPVVFTSNGSFFEEFQYLDFLSLQASTIGGFGINKPFMCNGANLAYSKAIFQELNGFSNNQDIASGDDVFLLEKFVEHYPNDVHYLKSYNAVVSTKPETSLKALIQQRVRWAAKSSNYTNWFGKLVAF